jgi:hypothetical protein
MPQFLAHLNTVSGVLGAAVLAITVVYSVPNLKITLHELFTLRRNRKES